MQRRKSSRKNQTQPDYYRIERNQDCLEDTRHMLRAQSSPKKKRQVGYKRRRQQLRAPARKKTLSLSLSQSLASEYEEKSESDDNEKGPTEDKRHGGWQMAATSVNWGRRNERDKDDDINDVNSNDNGQEQEMTRKNLSKGV